jgi:streptomycin 3"-adenylyltransferase
VVAIPGTEQAEQVVRLVDQVLGPDHIGSYLHGSAVLGGLRPASDVDILTVTARSLDDAQRRALVAGIMPLSGARAGRRPVELTIVVQSDIRPWRYPPVCDFLYGEWLRAEYEAGMVPGREPIATVSLELSVARAGDHPFFGPPPAQVLDPVPTADLTRASLAGIPSLLGDLATDRRNVLLAFARIWFTLANGTIATKDAAAAWALTRLPVAHRPVLEYARRLYLTQGYADEEWSDDLSAQVPAHVDEVLRRIGELAPPE